MGSTRRIEADNSRITLAVFMEIYVDQSITIERRLLLMQNDTPIKQNHQR